MNTATTTTALQWGAFTQDATSAAPSIDWEVLTPPQTDCLYLTRFSNVTLSQRAVAVVYHVAPSTVCRHVNAGVKKLWKLGRSGAVTRLESEPDAVEGSRIPCQVCDTPHLDCLTCLERYVMPEPVYRHARRGGLAQGHGTAELRHTVDLEHHARHHAKDDDWTLGDMQHPSPEE